MSKLGRWPRPDQALMGAGVGRIIVWTAKLAALQRLSAQKILAEKAWRSGPEAGTNRQRG